MVPEGPTRGNPGAGVAPSRDRDQARADGRSDLPILARVDRPRVRPEKVEAGERVGYVWFAPEDRPLGRIAFIYDIAVEPEHRRTGHAQAALAEIEAWARANECVGVQLHVFGSNAGARQLYLRAGYVETDVIMLKRVDG